MLSSNNIKSPAHGKPLTIPTQDMIIGIYYLTAARDGFEGEGRCFMDFKDAQNAYDARADVDLQAKIFVRLKYDTKVETSYGVYEDKKAGERIETTIGRIIFNSVLPKDYAFINHGMDKKEVGRLIEDCANTYKTPEMMQILDGLKALGFHYSHARRRYGIRSTTRRFRRIRPTSSPRPTRRLPPSRKTTRWAS